MARPLNNNLKRLEQVVLKHPLYLWVVMFHSPTSVRKVWWFFRLVAKTTEAIKFSFLFFLLCDHYDDTSWTSVYIHSLVQAIPVSNVRMRVMWYIPRMCFCGSRAPMQDAFSWPLKYQLMITILMNCSIHTIWTFRFRVSCLDCEDN